jgi:hypothetical protein
VNLGSERVHYKIIFMIHRSLFPAVFIPHEDFTPQKNVQSSTRGSAGVVTPLWGPGGIRLGARPQWGFGGEAPEGKIALQMYIVISL